MRKPSIEKRVKALVDAIVKNLPKMETELHDEQLKALVVGAANRYIENRRKESANV